MLRQSARVLCLAPLAAAAALAMPTPPGNPIVGPYALEVRALIGVNDAIFARDFASTLDCADDHRARFDRFAGSWRLLPDGYAIDFEVGLQRALAEDAPDAAIIAIKAARLGRTHADGNFLAGALESRYSIKSDGKVTRVVALGKVSGSKP